jgi:hypothetical protein
MNDNDTHQTNKGHRGREFITFKSNGEFSHRCHFVCHI